MIFKKGQNNETMPQVGQVVDACFIGEGENSHIRYMIPRVQFERITEFRDNKPDLVGHPAYFSIEPTKDGKSSIIDVWPAPDRRMEIKVRYFPPMEEC